MSHLTVPQALVFAVQHHEAGRLAEAETLYRKILAAQPNHPEALHLLGVLAHHAGRHEDAVEWIGRSLELNPADPSAHSNFGEACLALGRLDEAVTHYRRAIELDPPFAIACFNLANALRLQGRLDEAETAYRRTLELDPENAQALSNLAGTLAEQGRFDGAIAAYREALRLRPEDASIHSSLICLLRLHPAGDERALAEQQRDWCLHFEAPLRPLLRPHTRGRDLNRRLRVGYVSADFFVHAELFFLAPLFREHDHRQFEIHCYSGVARPDAGTELLRREADAWLEVRHLSDDELAAQIRADEIDILVDLSMHTVGNRLPVFARKPAPVQVSWLAYPGATGLAAMDHRITDAFLDPPASIDPRVTEKPVRLPDSWCCYHPVIDEVAINALPALSAGHITFGCLNSFLKFNDDTLLRFAGVLGAVEKSRLILLAPEGSARQRLIDRFRQCGISPDRVDYVLTGPREDYLRRYHHIDIALDTLPDNGMASTCETLWMGVPVVSLVGRTAVGRAGLSLLSTIGLTELAAHSPEDFVATAGRLAADLSRLAHLRTTLRSRMKASPLMDAPRFTRHMEAAYREMWREKSPE